MNTAIRAENVVDFIPDQLLDNFAKETDVDYSVKKLRGKEDFKLFLYGMLSGRKLSLRILATIFRSEKFKQLFNLPSKEVKHSTIGTRLSKINFQYFERIFEYLVTAEKARAVSLGDKKIDVSKIDSTIVALSCKLLKIGIEDGSKRMIKYSVEISGGIPVKVLFYRDQTYSSEDNALPALIARKRANQSHNITIFDRGIQRKETFCGLAKEQIFFISRLTGQKYRVKEELPFEKTKTASLKICSDQLIEFVNSSSENKQEFRLIVGINIKTKQKISFITNVNFLTAEEITELYKSRWEIETFFKFLKQELNFSHLLSRSENGIKAVAYLTLIAAILLTIYKKINNITGWIPAKIQFLDQLEQHLFSQWREQCLTVALSTNDRGFVFV